MSVNFVSSVRICDKDDVAVHFIDYIIKESGNYTLVIPTNDKNFKRKADLAHGRNMRVVVVPCIKIESSSDIKKRIVGIKTARKND